MIDYNDYLKEKIINLYFKKEKIGNFSIIEEDFKFLDQYFNNNIKPNIYDVSELLQNIINYYKTDFSLQNKIGLDFLNQLITSRQAVKEFLQQTPLSKPNITLIHKQELEVKYTTVANQYGLKEFYYTLNPNLSPNENYDKAILLLKKTCIELEKLQKHLNIEDSSKLGNGILSIQVNWQEDPRNNGYYNYCSIPFV